MVIFIKLERLLSFKELLKWVLINEKSFFQLKLKLGKRVLIIS